MKVFITRVIPAPGLEILQQAGCTITQWEEKRNPSREELIRMCRDHEIVLSAGHQLLDAEFFENCRHLRAISLLSAGYDHVDVKAATRWKIPIGHTPYVLNSATADIAVLLMLAVSRNAFYMSARIAAGDWGFYEPTANLGFELTGKTLGIFGLGRIGAEVARKCKAAFGMQIIYHNRNRNADAEKEFGARLVPFNELLATSDVVSVHADLSDETRGIFDLAAFKTMKPSAIFINTSRGALHKEGDLIEALQQNFIWGAGLDVTNPEPMAKDNPLLRMPRVCVVPHIGSATVETRDAMAVLAARNIVAVLGGNKMIHTVNPEVYGTRP